jgi:hypothetical protein
LDKHKKTKEPIAQELHLLHCLELIHHGDRQQAKVSLDAYKKSVTQVGLPRINKSEQFFKHFTAVHRPFVQVNDKDGFNKFSISKSFKPNFFSRAP